MNSDFPPDMSGAFPLHIQQQFARKYHNEDVSHLFTASSELADLFTAAEADTLIWLRLPYSAQERRTCTGIGYPSQWLLRYSSDVLRQSGFEKFGQLLDDEDYQRRQIGLLRRGGHLHSKDGIKYVLDLGPSDDDEARSEHLEALSLPRGIIHYSMLTELPLGQRAPVSAAGGHDDACTCFRQACLNKDKASPEADHQTDVEWEQDLPGLTDYPRDHVDQQLAHHIYSRRGTPATRCILEWDLYPELRIADYCEVRHAANVIRLLLAMAGRPLLLNSAARVYTICGLAKLFSAHASSIDQYAAPEKSPVPFVHQLGALISQWFFRENNVNMIDVLPQESFRMAWNIRLPDVVNAAYHILVAERALQDAGADSQPRRYRRQLSPFGRELSAIDDDLDTMLDHASEALIRRVQGVWEQLTNSGMQTQTLVQLHRHDSGVHSQGVCALPSLYRVQAVLSLLQDYVPELPVLANAQTKVEKLKDTYVQIIDKSLTFRRSRGLTDEAATRVATALRRYVRDSPSESTVKDIYKSLPQKQKLMTGIFWASLYKITAAEIRTYVLLGSLRQQVDSTNEALRMALVYYKLIGASSTASSAASRFVDELKAMDIQIAGEFASFHPDVPFDYDDMYYELFDSVDDVLMQVHHIDHVIPIIQAKQPGRIISPHLLLSLTNNELQFLPLWAGGNDDGTGAVFQNELPTAQLGPIGPGPAYHTGTTHVGTAATAAASTVAPSISATGDDDSASTYFVSEADLAGGDSNTRRGASFFAIRQGASTEDPMDPTAADFVLVREVEQMDIRSQDAGRGSTHAVASSRGVHSGKSTTDTMSLASSYVDVTAVDGFGGRAGVAESGAHAVQQAGVSAVSIDFDSDGDYSFGDDDSDAQSDGTVTVTFELDNEDVVMAVP